MTDAEQGQVASDVAIPAEGEEHTRAMVQDAVADFMRKMTGAPNPATVPHVSRWAERDNRRQANAQLAREAAQRRVARKSAIGLVERVGKAATRLNGVNTAGAIQVINQASPADYDLLLLAEKYAGQNRVGVLKQFGAPRRSVETAYLAEAGLASPEDAPDEGAEE